MRLMRTLVGVFTCSCAVVASASAGQHVQHSTPATTSTAAAPATAPSHPTSNTAHPAPVPVPQKIAANPALVARLQPLLPSGTTLSSAATGFRNQGQFIAALHVSRNLNIPFAQLKAEMTGTDHDSLGQAIHELKPTINAKVAAKTAERQARTDLKATQPAKADADDKDDR